MMLANYSFNGKVPKKLGDPGIPTIPCSINNNYVRTALCDLGAGVSVMPFSLYKRLYLDKLIPTDISLQMADKSTAIPVGICEDVLFKLLITAPAVLRKGLPRIIGILSSSGISNTTKSVNIKQLLVT